jgi:hypothetical protein
MYTITLELPGEIYRRAQQVAQATQRPIEQVVVEWIHIPQIEVANEVADLAKLSNEQLTQVARSHVPSDQSHRLRELLEAQQQRTLTKSEQREAVILVEQEELVTLRKARALFLLKQRGVLPQDLALFLT